jgi:hypothetical protein
VVLALTTRSHDAVEAADALGVPRPTLGRLLNVDIFTRLIFASLAHSKLADAYFLRYGDGSHDSCFITEAISDAALASMSAIA